MTLPSGQISIDDLYTESDSGSTTIYSLAKIARDSYFQGVNGSAANTYNGFGRDGGNSGADRIFDFSAGTSPQSMSQFQSKTYYYDGANFVIEVGFDNQLPFLPPPDPPDFNDFIIELNLFDSTDTYQYLGDSVGAPAGQQGSGFLEQANTTPLLAIAYWEIIISSFGGGGGTVNVDINGTNFVNTTAPSAGGQLTLDHNTYGSASTDSSGLFFDITFS